MPRHGGSPAPIREAEKLASKADRESSYADTAPAGDQEMAHLVDENDGREHDQRRDHVVPDHRERLQQEVRHCPI